MSTDARYLSCLQLRFQSFIFNFYLRNTFGKCKVIALLAVIILSLSTQTTTLVSLYSNPPPTRPKNVYS